MSQIFIGKLIEEELRSQDRSVVWFANKLSCNRTKYAVTARMSTRYSIAQASIQSFCCVSAMC